MYVYTVDLALSVAADRRNVPDIHIFSLCPQRTVLLEITPNPQSVQPEA